MSRDLFVLNSERINLLIAVFYLKLKEEVNQCLFQGYECKVNFNCPK